MAAPPPGKIFREASSQETAGAKNPMTTKLLTDAQASLTRDLRALPRVGHNPAASIACAHRILATLDTLVHDDETPPNVNLVIAALDAVEGYLPNLADANMSTEIQNLRQALRPGN